MARGQSTQIVIGMAAAGFIAGAMVVGAFAPGHGPGPAAAEDSSYVRAIHASPDSPPIDVTVDGTVGLSAATFGAVGSYLEHPAGTADLTVSRAGDGTTELEHEVVLRPRTAKTIAVTGTSTAGIELHVFDDAPVTTVGNDATVRVVHLALDAPPVAVTANDRHVLTDRVGFGNASEYVTAPAGEYTLDVRMETDVGNEPAVEPVSISVAGGTATSVFIMPDGTSEDGPVTVVVEDASMSLQLPAETAAEPVEAGR